MSARASGLRRYPVAFDYPFVLWYLTRYASENPFGYAVIDIRSYAMAYSAAPFGRADGTRCPRAGLIPCPIPMWRWTMPSSRGTGFATCPGAPEDYEDDQRCGTIIPPRRYLGWMVGSSPDRGRR
jgi:hypothetical protein